MTKTLPTIANANINNIHDVNLQPPAVPQPRADLPPELQNARPSGRSILARVAAFFLGAGAAGSASALLGGGTLLSGVIGTTATAFLGATAVAGIATGGAALIGGAIGLGIFAGIRALVNHFRRAPDPQPRVQNNSGLPQARPSADIYNNTVAQAIRRDIDLPSSLQQAAGNVISRMREIYGEALVPQGAKLSEILGWRKDRLATEIGKLNDAVTTQKMEELVEKHMRQSMLYASLNKAIMPLCGQNAFQTEEMRRIAATKNPDLVDALTNAASQEEVQDILAQFTDKVQEMKTETVTMIQNADIPQDLKARWIEKARNGEISGTAQAQSLIENVPGLPAEVQPMMERSILLRSYAPDSAGKSSNDAHKLAQEFSKWGNFNSADEPVMAPVNEWFSGNISNTLYEGQTYDENGISSQLKLDAPRGTYTINGTVLNRQKGDVVADAIIKAMPTKEAAKMVSASVNQRSFSPINALGMQFDEIAGAPLAPELKSCLGKMAARDITDSNGGGPVHIDLGAQFKNLADNRYTVSVEGNKVHIELSELVGLDAGVGAGADSKPRLGGLARYTVHFECDLGPNGKNPHIESIHFQQELLPYEAEPVNAQ